MAWAGARAGRSRRRRGCAAGTPPRTRPRGPRRRSPPAAARARSCRRALAVALREELRVELERVGELLGQLEVGEDRVDRTRLDTRVAIDAHRRVDVELLGGLEVVGVRRRVDALDRADLDARVILDARADDDVGHGPEATRPRARASSSRGAACGLTASPAAGTMSTVLLAELTATSEAVRATSARGAKVARLAETLRRMAPEEVAVGVAHLSGELRQRQIGVGWRSLRDLPAPAGEATLTLADVDDACERIGAMAGPGSQAARREALSALF